MLSWNIKGYKGWLEKSWALIRFSVIAQVSYSSHNFFLPSHFELQASPARTSEVSYTQLASPSHHFTYSFTQKSSHLRVIIFKIFVTLPPQPFFFPSFCLSFFSFVFVVSCLVLYRLLFLASFSFLLYLYLVVQF